MGLVYAEITLKNARDVGNAFVGIITESEVRKVKITAMVGAGTLVIDEATFKALGLVVRSSRNARIANGEVESCMVTEPVEIQWNDRYSACQALVLPGVKHVLLGAIPLEDMDLVVHPKSHELVGAHGDEVITLIY